ANSRFPTSII
nr:Chain C, F-iCAL36 peptide [synthetic construct]4JOJ_D Chain D, F-iCAL36 peptide [synthetic construct]4NNL_C Chain C, TIP-1 PDZ domain [synthetic construct]4NNL_D Chain D, TIP-1 PDZ domain [synthetic construct]